VNQHRKILIAAIIVSMGGFLLGFDSALIAGVTSPLEKKFSLTELQLGWLVSSCLFGALLGNAITGVLTTKFGRKNVLIFTAVLFFASSLGCAVADNYSVFIAARVVGGLGIGIAILAAPMYIAEIAPKELRGRLVSINQLNIVIGISLSFFSNRIIYDLAGKDDSWRWMIGVGAIPALIYFVALFFVFESPRWLVMTGQDEKARKVIKTMRNDADPEAEYREIKQSLSEGSKVPLSEVFSKRMRFVVGLGIAIAFFQQITGINAVFYYAPKIIEKTGIGTDAALTQAIFVGLANLLFTLVAMRLIDKLGRKPLLIIGSIGICCAHSVLALAFHYNLLESKLVLFGVVGFVSFFAISWGPVMWVLLSEIYPNKFRGMGISLAGLAGGIISFIVSLIFPWQLDKLGPAGTFGIFAAFALLSLFFVIRFVPETKGKSLEELGEELTRIKQN
jgi:MFS transporter, SP family, arabinose:H+ symporter